MAEDGLPVRFRALVSEFLKDGRIEADEVARLRRDVFSDGVVDRDEAEFLFHLDSHSEGNAPEWAPFFVQALGDYFVVGTEPVGCISADDGAFLVDRVTHDGRIDHRTEFDLLVDVASRAYEVPASVVDLILDAVKESVLRGGAVKFGPSRRRAGVIDDADVDILEKVLYGTGGAGGFTIDRKEAEMLFDLNDAARGKRNSARWRDLFVRAVGNYLMFPRGDSDALTGEALRRRAEFLDSPTEGFLRKALVIAAREGPLAGFRTAAELEENERRRQSAAEHEAVERARVDVDEAAWLIERIGRDGELDENEEALLDYLRDKATEVDPSLAPLLEGL